MCCACGGGGIPIYCICTCAPDELECWKECFDCLDAQFGDGEEEGEQESGEEEEEEEQDGGEVEEESEEEPPVEEESE